MELIDYLQTRRSSLSMTLVEPGPDREQIRSIVEVAMRVPDHGKLAPWRFELWESAARKNMHRDLGGLLDQQGDSADKEKQRVGTDKLLHAPCVIAVICTASDHPKIPLWEQHLSTGAACMNTLMAANALGFEAQWLTAWYVYDAAARSILGLSDGEMIAGIIHIGTSDTEKNERPRPDFDTHFSVRES